MAKRWKFPSLFPEDLELIDYDGHDELTATLAGVAQYQREKLELRESQLKEALGLLGENQRTVLGLKFLHSSKIVDEKWFIHG